MRANFRRSIEVLACIQTISEYQRRVESQSMKDGGYDIADC